MDLFALSRVPWVAAKWDLVDLQIDLRSGEVSGSLFENEVQRLRVNDHFRVAVVFFDPVGEAVDPLATRLRWTLRDQQNDEPLMAMTLEPAVAATDESTPYFLLEPDTLRLSALATERGEAGSVLRCASDFDWIVEGKLYSSRTFTVVIELEGASFDGGGTTPPPPLPPPTPPTTPQPPLPPLPPTPPPPPPPLDEAALRALFDQWLVEKLPVEEGFLYVRDGEITDAVPGGDCSGEVWTP